MQVVRPVLLGLAAGAALAFVVALLSPRRERDPAGGYDAGAEAPVVRVPRSPTPSGP